MDPQFLDRTLKCTDCQADFIFTAGEQIFFFDKQFKNDPRRCKPCKGRRTSLSAVATGAPLAAAVHIRTETRTLCSDCGIETTVPFKPTQGRPVLCRQCFQVKARAARPASVSALTALSANGEGAVLSPEAAVLAVASMEGAPENSSIATTADLASISELEGQVGDASGQSPIPAELLAAAGSEARALELLAAAADAPKA